MTATPTTASAPPQTIRGRRVRRVLTIRRVAVALGLAENTGPIWRARYGIRGVHGPTAPDKYRVKTVDHPLPPPDTWCDGQPAWTWPAREEDFQQWMRGRPTKGAPGRPKRRSPA